MTSGIRRPVILSLTFVLMLSFQAEAQAPCVKSLDSVNAALQELALEAGQRAISEGAQRLGERALQTAEGGAFDRGARIARQGEELGSITRMADVKGFILDPIKAYMESPDEVAATKALQVILENSAKKAFPTAGLVLEAGRVVIGSATFAVQDLIDEGKRQEYEAAIFGRGQDVALGTINNLLAEDPFFTSGPVVNRGLTRDDVGSKVKSEDELRQLWFTYYRAYLLGGGQGLSASNRAAINDALNAGWPHLHKYWAFKRAQLFTGEMQRSFRADIERARAKMERNELGSCGFPTKVRIDGKWGALGFVYEISQSAGSFSWKRERDSANEEAQGEFESEYKVKAAWKNTLMKGSATGTVTTDENGRGILITWTNGVVFVRK